MTDLVDGLVRLMESNYTLPVNLGNPIEHTIEGSFKIVLLFQLYNYISLLFL